MMNELRHSLRPPRWPALLPLAAGAAGIALVACGGGGEGKPASQVISGAEETSSGALGARELVPLLTRSGVGSGGAGLDVTYAPQRFFEITGLKRPDDMDSRPTLAFILQETLHEGELPIDPPQMFMEVGAGDRIEPYSAEVTAEDPHHRTTRVLFPQPDGWSETGKGDTSTLTVVVPRPDGAVSKSNTFVWQLPVDLGEDVGSAER